MNLFQEHSFNEIGCVQTRTQLTSSSSGTSTAGPLWASWKRSFFILRDCRLSSSLTASLVRWIRSISTDSGRSRWTNACWTQTEVKRNSPEKSDIHKYCINDGLLCPNRFSRLHEHTNQYKYNHNTNHIIFWQSKHKNIYIFGHNTCRNTFAPCMRFLPRVTDPCKYQTTKTFRNNLAAQSESNNVQYR